MFIGVGSSSVRSSRPTTISGEFAITRLPSDDAHNDHHTNQRVLYCLGPQHLLQQYEPRPATVINGSVFCTHNTSDPPSADTPKVEFSHILTTLPLARLEHPISDVSIVVATLPYKIT